MTTDTVSDRLAFVRRELSTTALVAGLAVAVALGFTIAFVQEPLAHDAMHNFRHAAGITCH